MKNIIMSCLPLLLLDATATDGGGSTTAPTEVQKATEAETNEVDADTKEEVKPLVELDGIPYVKEEFKMSRATGTATPITGWGFAKPCYKTVQQAIDHLNKLIKEQNKEGITGEQIVLDLMDTALAAKLRIRVKANTPGVGDPGFSNQQAVNDWFIKKEDGNPDKLLFTPEDAHNWIPGLRELSAKKQLEQKMEQVKKMIGELGPTHPDVQKMLVEIATGMAGV